MTEPPVLLAVDIGNTTITLGAFRATRLVNEWRLSSRELRTADEYRAVLTQLLTLPASPTGIIVCSVVPKLVEPIADAFTALYRVTPVLVGRDLTAPLTNRYHPPEQVGQDRLVNAVAATRCYGAPVIIVDFGTAVTIDVVTPQGEYAGGIIAPGLELSLESLAERTALLPRIELEAPRSVLGTDTRGSMLSGVVFGLGALCDGLVRQLQAQLHQSGDVVATGGQAVFMRSFCPCLTQTDPALTLKGLQMLWADAHPG